MLGTLSEGQIERFLSQQVIGRLGCHYEGKTYVVPINFFYKEGVIYAHSALGKKIRMMRGNPNVCFQVDEILDTFNWKSIILWGTYKEITDADHRQQAMQGLRHRIMPLTSVPGEHPSHGLSDDELDLEAQLQTIVYRIDVEHRTGRFEQHDAV